MQPHPIAGATPASNTARKSALLFMFKHPAGIWLRACREFGRGDMLVNATVHSRSSGRPLAIGGAR